MSTVYCAYEIRRAVINVGEDFSAIVVLLGVVQGFCFVRIVRVGIFLLVSVSLLFILAWYPNSFILCNYEYYGCKVAWIPCFSFQHGIQILSFYTIHIISREMCIVSKGYITSGIVT